MTQKELPGGANMVSMKDMNEYRNGKKEKYKPPWSFSTPPLQVTPID